MSARSATRLDGLSELKILITHTLNILLTHNNILAAHIHYILLTHNDILLLLTHSAYY